MPIDVDPSQRLAEIAAATVAVARARGTRAVTVRSVADELGRSTAFITHFVSTRAQLMVNALEHGQAHWEKDREARLRGLNGRERLVALARWMCSTFEGDAVLRSLWIEVIADVRADNRAAYDVVRATTESTYGEFISAANESDLHDARSIADALYLFGRGYHVKSIEDPADWTDERVNRSLDVIIGALLFNGERRVVQPGASA